MLLLSTPVVHALNHKSLSCCNRRFAFDPLQIMHWLVLLGHLLKIMLTFLHANRWWNNSLYLQVGNRIIKKRIHVRVEHVQPSRCQEDFRSRVKKNDQLKAEANARGEIISTKRQPEGPKPGFMVEGATLETVTPIPYDVVNDLKGGY